MGSLELNPSIGNVAFGSGKECWGFTLTRFARIYSKKFGVDEKKMMERLWGENYFDPTAKVWNSSGVDAAGK
jgi:elongation factor 2